MYYSFKAIRPCKSKSSLLIEWLFAPYAKKKREKKFWGLFDLLRSMKEKKNDVEEAASKVAAFFL